MKGRKKLNPKDKKVPIRVFVKAKNLKTAKKKLSEAIKEFNQ